MITELFYVVLIILILFFISFGISYAYMEQDLLSTLVLFDFFLALSCIYGLLGGVYWSLILIVLTLCIYLVFKK